MKLYEITDELAAVWELLEESGGELTPDIEARLESLDIQRQGVVENICKLIRTLQREQDAIKAEIADLWDKAGRKQNTVDRLKDYLQSEMKYQGLERLKTPLFTIWRQRNGRPSIRPEGDRIPGDFLRTREEFDGQAAYEYWKRHGSCPGCVVELGEHLRIR